MSREFQHKEIGSEILPKLTEEEENSFISVLDQGEIVSLQEARLNPRIIDKIFSIKTVEVTGMPHLRKTTMLKRFQNDCQVRGLEIELHQEKNSLKKSVSANFDLGEYNLGFIYEAQKHLFVDGNSPNYSRIQIFDRGILGQIPFFESLEGSNTKTFSYTNDLFSDFLVNNYGQWIDALIICNSNPKICFADPKNKLDREYLLKLSENYQELPETIRKYRRKFLLEFHYNYQTSPLLIVNLNADVGWNKFKYNFMRSLGSVLNIG